MVCCSSISFSSSFFFFFFLSCTWMVSCQVQREKRTPLLNEPLKEQRGYKPPQIEFHASPPNGFKKRRHHKHDDDEE
ncbi:hypothetical protein V8C37DRAFT_371728 [Trichoderma ceciliae]